MRADLEQVTFREAQPEAKGPKAKGRNRALRVPDQVWDFWAPGGSHAFAQADVRIGEERWGVILRDRAPELLPEDLVSLVRKFLTWTLGCRVDTVELVLERNKSEHHLVRVGGEFI